MTPLEALQATLAGEHAAVYLYGVIGGQVSRAAEPELSREINQSYLTHRRRRDRLEQLVARRNASPVASAPSYRLPSAVADPDQLRAVARGVERRCVALYGQLVGSTAGHERAWAIATLESAAVEALAYGVAPSAFPGLTRPGVTRPR